MFMFAGTIAMTFAYLFKIFPARYDLAVNAGNPQLHLDAGVRKRRHHGIRLCTHRGLLAGY